VGRTLAVAVNGRIEVYWLEGADAASARLTRLESP